MRIKMGACYWFLIFSKHTACLHIAGKRFSINSINVSKETTSFFFPVLNFYLHFVIIVRKFRIFIVSFLFLRLFLCVWYFPNPTQLIGTHMDLIWSIGFSKVHYKKKPTQTANREWKYANAKLWICRERRVVVLILKKKKNLPSNMRI